MSIIDQVIKTATETMGTLQLKIAELQSIQKSGFFDLENPKIICNDKNHNPPSNLHIPEGKGYRHVCPSCGKTVEIISPAMTS